MMIFIERDECPSVLEGSPRDGDHYNKRVVVLALRRMQHNKCCYCEKEVPRRGQGKQVEHFRPQETPEFKKYRNHWPNLLLSCQQCNGEKSDHFPRYSNGSPKLIDPSRTKPERHIEFSGNVEDEDEPMGAVEPITSRGKITMDVIGLNLVDQQRARKKYFRMNVLPIYIEMKRAKANDKDDVLQRERLKFEKLMDEKSEFSNFVRSVARNMELDNKYNLNIPLGA